MEKPGQACHQGLRNKGDQHTCLDHPSPGATCPLSGPWPWGRGGETQRNASNARGKLGRRRTMAVWVGVWIVEGWNCNELCVVCVC